MPRREEVLSYNPVTRVKETFHYDFATGEWAIETQQDMEPIIEQNKAMANDDEFTRQGIKEGMWRYASIPVEVQMKWLVEYGLDNWPMNPRNEKLLIRLLNSPEWRYLKTTSKTHA